MKSDIRVFELPGDYAEVIDGDGDGSLVEVGAETRAGGVKANKVAAGGTQEAVRHHVRVRIGAYDRALVIIGKRLRSTKRRALWNACCACVRSIEHDDVGVVKCGILRWRPRSHCQNTKGGDG